MSDKEEIFREGALDRIATPDKLNDYIRVSSPSVWIILSSIIVLLIGVCFWGVFGNIESKVDALAIIENGKTIIYVSPEEGEKIEKGAEVHIDDTKGNINGNVGEPLQIDNSFNEYALYVGGLAVGEWKIPFTADVSMPDGVYKAQIVVETISPASFLIN